MKTFYIFIIANLFLKVAICQTDTKQPLSIGDHYGGGIIFYIDSTRQHGLIVTKTDLSAKAPYGCPALEIYANSPGNGIVNTILITKYCGEGTAGSLCHQLKIGNYEDWYLPSINELALLFKSMLPPDFFSTGIYLSSSECRDCRREFVCWAIDFLKGGNRITIYKDKKVYVRAIRKF